MTSEQARIRNAEILKSFRRMTEYAEQQKIRLVLIAGDLFDRERITKRTVEGVLDAVRSTPQIDYLYVRGNHDDKTHAFVDQDIPQNFIISRQDLKAPALSFRETFKRLLVSCTN